MVHSPGAGCCTLRARFLVFEEPTEVQNGRNLETKENSPRCEFLVSCRSVQEDEPSLAEAGAAPGSLSGMKTEAQPSTSSLANTSWTGTVISDTVPGSQTWEDKGPFTWSAASGTSEAQVSAARVAEAKALEAHVFEAQARASQPKQISVLEAATASILKQKSTYEKVQMTEKKESEVLLARPFWSSKAEYILAQVGFSMKPSCLWRFAHLWLNSGGCSFAAIYIFMLFLVGIPLVFLEMAAGQSMRQGGMGVWKIIAPWIGGVGYSSFMVCFILGLYFNVVNSWIIFYMSQSFQFPVPWEKCPLTMNSSGFDPACEQTAPSIHFWYRQTLKASDRIEDGGSPVYSLVLPFCVCWCLVGAFMINGLKSTGKVICVLVLLPYFIIIGFFIRSLLLEGAKFGLQQLVVAKISDVYNVSVWSVAGGQVLFNTGIGLGSVASLASYMPQSNNCLSDAFLVSVINLLTLLIVTSFNFSVLGFWATIITHRCCERNAEILLKLINLGKLPPDARPPLDLLDNPTSTYNTWFNGLPQHIKSMVLREVTECNIETQFLKASEGPKFVFLSFVEAMSFLPLSVFWSFIFFLMLLTMGLSSAIGIMQGIVTPLQDNFSFFRKHTKLLIVGLFLLMFACGLFFTQPSGSHFIKLLSNHWIVFPIIVIAIFETMAVSWAYGARRFLADLTILLGHPISPIYGWLWPCVCPVVLLILFVTVMVHLCMKPITYMSWDSSTSKEVLRPYPPWALLLMITLFAIVIFPIPAYFVYCLIHRIPFRPKSRDRPITASTSLSLSHQLTPSKEVQKEEILQGDETKYPSTSHVTS
ncbi:orphan sodium- and chloride-dependent neurotransmitter transporter NTT5 isoform X2 [Macaca thibetana thibetana]|uniref:orphan sodium- and chloride-dependent neurotransmitter transporter NTT5 isoform X2 n=1 Tax=Macaca thibetana thibetana TaxID=257877 RepID=UPI0021BCAE51|nr:orphan sodium- and chloride-dependent neurotransmitter transporter NTT5 isoform X2 [Macaca thibetana thibetana]